MASSGTGTKSSQAKSTASAKDLKDVFLDIQIDDEFAGRIVIKLFDDKVPRTAKNFRQLCEGTTFYSGRFTGKHVQYKDSTFHRIIKGLGAQGGDFSHGNGTGGECYHTQVEFSDTKYFDDEDLTGTHDARGTLTMANHGRHTNASQFFITFDRLPHLDGRNVVFGKVSDGMEVLDMIEEVETDVIGKPMKTVKIVNCGVQEEDDSDLRPSITPGQGTSRQARMRRKNKQLAGGEPQVR